MRSKTRVLIVDNSAVVRQTISSLLSMEDDIEVIATASDPYQAAEKIAYEAPDVIILDINMPRMDGLTFLKKIMEQHPIPVIICSSFTGRDSDATIKALRYGAVDVIVRPETGAGKYPEELGIRIADSIRAASAAGLKKMNRLGAIEPVQKLTADVIMPKAGKTVFTETSDKVIVAGASTGGTEALTEFLGGLPPDTAGVVVVQHMPEKFTTAFAERLDQLCGIRVKEAKNGDAVLNGQALIAPGNYHTLLRRGRSQYFVEVKEGPLVTRHRPSVDVLFRSTAYYAGKNAVGVIMTGMGDDGAKGMKEMKEAGAYTIAQDEESCIVFGMPKEAIKLNAVDRVLPLNRLAGAVSEFCRQPGYYSR